jgi:hypothetical protein
VTTMPGGILFFSRGRGRGHAIPDLAIVARLKAARPDVDVEFVSYATGADALRRRGESVVDLDLPERNDFVLTILRAAQVLAVRKPALVVAHEEPAALVAARIAGIRTIFMSHWFMVDRDPFATALGCADDILFLERPGLFDEPIEAKGRVHYVGPLLRPLCYTLTDRDRARQELGIAPQEVLVLVVPGSFLEKDSPICDLVLGAFMRLRANPKRLVWVAGADRRTIQEAVGTRGDVLVLDTDWQLERWMVASDVAITKATYNIGLELSALGTPSVSLSYGRNHIDDLYARRVESNLFLWATETTPAQLADCIESRLLGGRPAPAEALLGNTGVERAAALIADRVDSANTSALRSR